MRLTGKLTAAILIAGLAAALPATNADEDNATAAHAVLDDLLRATCRVGASGEIVDQLRQYQDLLTPVLIELLEEGPGTEMIAQERRSLQHRWARREAFLSSQPALGLGNEERRIADSETRRDYIQRGLERFLGRYRERVANGLRTIASPEALEALALFDEQAEDLGRARWGLHAPDRTSGGPADGRRQDPAQRTRERSR